MKKRFLSLIPLLFCGVFAFAVDQGPIDLVVVIDTSSSMSTSYRQVSEYAIGPMLKDFLRLGDTFHLIGFSSVPKVEISRQIEGSGDIETIVSRMLLLYPLDPNSDVIASLEYLSRYLADLPENRSKTVIFISDGEHSPPPSSPYASLTDESVATKITETTSRLKGNGWNFYYLKVPFSGSTPLRPLVSRDKKPIPSDSSKTSTLAAEIPNVAGSQSAGKVAGATQAPPQTSVGATATPKQGAILGTQAPTAAGSTLPSTAESQGALDVSGPVADLLAAPVITFNTEADASKLSSVVGSISAVFPTDLGKKSRSITVPITLHNPSPQDVYIETEAILIDGKDMMTHRSLMTLKPRSDKSMSLHIELPKATSLGTHTFTVEPVFASGLRITPQSGTIKVELVNRGFSKFMAVLFPILLFVLGLAAAVLLTMLVLSALRKVSASPVKTVYHHAHRADTFITAQTQAAAAPAQKSEATKEEMEKYRKATKGQDDSGADLLASFKSQTSRDAASRDAAVLAAAVSMGPAREKATKLQAPTSVPAHYEIRKASERIMLSLYVEDQNTAIGKRNVHLIKAGSSLSVGGGRSDFLVFLVPLPAHIADLHFDGERCILIPRHGEFFPETGSAPIEDCVGKTIKLVSQKGYDLKIRFDRYEDPLIKLNSFLHSIEVPSTEK